VIFGRVVVVKVSQVPAVPWVHTPSITWSKGRSVLQDCERVRVGVSYDTWKTAAAAREEGNTAGAQENTRQNDCWGLL